MPKRPYKAVQETPRSDSEITMVDDGAGGGRATPTVTGTLTRSSFGPSVPAIIVTPTKKRPLSESAASDVVEQGLLSSPTVSNADSEPLKKRVKMTSFKLNPHPKHFDDATTIIIQVESTSFRVAKNLLTTESEWFKERFASSEGPDLDELIQGSEVYILDIPVKADDFSALLDFLNDPLLYRSIKAPHSALCGIFSASSFLSFPRYRDWAIFRLENQYWASDLSKIGGQCARTVADCFLILTLSKTFGHATLKKRALYDLVRSRTSFEAILKDDSLDEQLGYKVFGAIAVAREAFSESWAEKASPIILDPKCTKCDHDIEKAYAVYMHHPNDGLYKKYLFDPIAGLQALVDVPWEKEDDCCQDCIDRMRDAWKTERQALWNKLDDWVDLL